MSLAIDIEKVRRVLLADGWHDVDDSSFALDSYEFEYQGAPALRGGEDPLVPAVGFEFVSRGVQMYGPLTAIQAVECA